MSRSLQLGLRTGDLFPNPSIARSCCIQITKLKVLRGLSREEPQFYLALQASSRRVQARGDEVIMPQFNDAGESELKFQNPLSVSFEYQHFTKGRPNVLYISLQKKKKYRTRAVPGYKTLARGQINLDDIIQLPPTNPFTIKLFQTEKDSKDSRQIQIGTLEISEVSSIPTEDDDAKYVSDSSDDEENSDRRNKNNSVASRVKNAMLTKILAKLIKTNPHINPEDLDLDGQDLNEIDISELRLYDELEDFAISEDEDELFDDDVSIASTPRPNLKPYFDNTSQCSLQPRSSIGISSSSRNEMIPPLDAVVEDKIKESSSDGDKEVVIDQDENEPNRKTPRKMTRPQKSFETNSNISLQSESIDLIHEMMDDENSVIMLLIHDSTSDPIIHQIMENVKSVKILQIQKETMDETFNTIIKRRDHKEKTVQTKDRNLIRICVCASVDNINAVVKIYMDQMCNKLYHWSRYHFSFTFLPLDENVSKQHLSHRFGQICPIYRNLFLDTNWYTAEGIESILEKVVKEATTVTNIPVAEAMVSFTESRSDGNSQLFIPFCVELLVQETDNDDTDSDDNSNRQVISPTSSPFITSNQASINSNSNPSEKLHLSIDYWTDGGEKKSIKETLKSLEFKPSQNSVVMKLQLRAKRGGINNLPGRKKKDDREKRENVTRVICKSILKKSKMAKLTIDGLEYENVSFFQITSSEKQKLLPVSLFTELEVAKD